MTTPQPVRVTLTGPDGRPVGTMLVLRKPAGAPAAPSPTHPAPARLQ